MDELLVDFVTESAEELEAIERRVADARRDGAASAVIEELSPRLHAIAGTRGLLDLPRLQRIASASEPLFEQLRGEGVPAALALDMVVRVVERLRTLLGATRRGPREPEGDDSEWIARIEQAAASALANRRGAPEPASDRRAFLTVFALNEAFALPIAATRSAVRINALTGIPSAPSHHLGQADLGGRAVAVVCLARRLEPTARPARPDALAILVSARERTFALMVEDFGEIVEAGEEDVTPLAAPIATSRAALSSHVLRVGAVLAPILDPELVFDPPRHADASSYLPSQAGD